MLKFISSILLIFSLSSCAIMRAEPLPTCNKDYIKDLEISYICLREYYTKPSIPKMELCNESLNSIKYKLEFNRGKESVAYNQVDNLTRIQTKTLYMISTRKSTSLININKSILQDAFITTVKTEKVGGCNYGY